MRQQRMLWRLQVLMRCLIKRIQPLLHGALLDWGREARVLPPPLVDSSESEDGFWPLHHGPDTYGYGTDETDSSGYGEA